MVCGPLGLETNGAGRERVEIKAVCVFKDFPLWKLLLRPSNVLPEYTASIPMYRALLFSKKEMAASWKESKRIYTRCLSEQLPSNIFT